MLSSRGPQSLGCRAVPVCGLLGTRPHSRRWVAGERVKLHLPLPIAPRRSPSLTLPPETSPLQTPRKNCLPWNGFLVPKRLGTAVVKASLVSFRIPSLIWVQNINCHLSFKIQILSLCFSKPSVQLKKNVGKLECNFKMQEINSALFIPLMTRLMPYIYKYYLYSNRFL